MPAKKAAPATKASASKKAAPAEKPAAPKVDGRAAVEAWFDRVKSPEMQSLARRVDALILEGMPDAVCAVKWNAPFYGLAGRGWIASINAFKAHVKLLLFDGSQLEPTLPEGKDHNQLDVRSIDELEQHEKQIKAWLRQAKKLPGWLRV
jgi:hypothetical protein